MYLTVTRVSRTHEPEVSSPFNRPVDQPPSEVYHVPESAVTFLPLSQESSGSIPWGSSAIAALSKNETNSRVLGITLGNQSAMFEFSLRDEEIWPLGQLKGVRADKLVQAGDQVLLAGVPAGGTTSHLYFVPAAEIRPSVATTQIDLTPLDSLPRANERIVALEYADSGSLVGLTSPSDLFFEYDLTSESFRALEVLRDPLAHLPWAESGRGLLALSNLAFCGGHAGRLFMYDLEAHRLVDLGVRLPGPKGRSWTSWVDVLVEDDGVIYGGTSDGYLFSYHLGATEVKNHGKPLPEGRIWSLAKDGFSLYGTGGERDSMSRLFEFSLETYTYRNHGLLERQGMDSWLVRRPHCLLAIEEGVLLIGEADLGGHLIIVRTESLEN